jgi:cardiolipin synthase
VDRPSSPPAPSLRRALEALLGTPFTPGNELRVLRDAAETFRVLHAAVAGARRSIDMLWFAWGDDPVAEEIATALAERARHGVRVRLLLDGFGSLHIPQRQVRTLRRAGCRVEFRRLRTWRLTALNTRNHQRVLVCDEQLAFTGGTGLAPSWTGAGDDTGPWRETAVLLTGPAVNGLRGVFAAEWQQTRRMLTGPADFFPAPATSGPAAVQVLHAAGRPGLNQAAVAVHALLELARDRVRITTPYVRLPPHLHRLLQAAARRGVQVQLVVSSRHVARRSVQLQSQRGYADLLAAGVEIWRYQPTVMHAKTLTVDGALAMIGTVNLDLRSLALNGQVGILTDEPAVTAAVDAHIDDDIDHSQRLTAGQWRRRGLRQRALEIAADVAGKPLRGLGAAGLTGPEP